MPTHLGSNSRHASYNRLIGAVPALEAAGRSLKKYHPPTRAKDRTRLRAHNHTRLGWGIFFFLLDALA